MEKDIIKLPGGEELDDSNSLLDAAVRTAPFQGSIPGRAVFVTVLGAGGCMKIDHDLETVFPVNKSLIRIWTQKQMMMMIMKCRHII